MILYRQLVSLADTPRQPNSQSSDHDSADIFIFGMTVDQVNNLKKTYRPRDFYERSADLRRVLDAIRRIDQSNPSIVQSWDGLVRLVSSGQRGFVVFVWSAFRFTAV